MTIEDALPSQLDWTTAKILSAEVGGTSIPLEEGPQKPGKRTVHGTAVLDAVSGREVIAEGELDEASGRIVMHLEGPPNLDDPFSPTPYSDFLPQNTKPPIGEGAIRVEAWPHAGLGTGVTISDGATVTFDDHLGGTPLQTPTALNTIDADPPSVAPNLCPQKQAKRSRSSGSPATAAREWRASTSSSRSTVPRS